jgi:hypothetical protein
MPFVSSCLSDLDEYRCVERTVTAEEIADAETLSIQFEPLLVKLVSQLCWSFWQSRAAFPGQSLARSVSNNIQTMGII